MLLLGQISEELLRLLYAGSDVFVMPNIPVAGDIEGFGVVMLEAGGYGLPVLAANLEGIKDVVEDGENGRLLPPGDADAFRHAIEEFHDARVRLEASDRAEKYVRERFGWDAIAERYVQILKRRSAEELEAPAKDGDEAPEDLGKDPQEHGSEEKL